MTKQKIEIIDVNVWENISKRLETLGDRSSRRKAGIKVSDVNSLVEKLKNEAKVI